ncbi:serine hydrolase domain-containing protein [Amycolatopsis vastitatis]|uniref:Beta-lactamase-related domain-containing protein n=1 Tax=Amycolatopsis vastitatis TaxID=1905142 RepID=A0A229SL19_9PSEU|nr:serine hydrolase domain-containing protein [Amycolatopsis vastitatis]OXM59480.1 hypothetical protein CF165_47490 [Amycolatopsis vastitatis]
MLAYLRTLPLRFTPGSQWSYSNDGYFLLGAVTAAVAGVTYYDYVRRNVFAPAGLTHTDFYTRPQVIADRTIAHGYLSQQHGPGRRPRHSEARQSALAAPSPVRERPIGAALPRCAPPENATTAAPDHSSPHRNDRQQEASGRNPGVHRRG